jgi:hypothetical protein
VICTLRKCLFYLWKGFFNILPCFGVQVHSYFCFLSMILVFLRRWIQNQSSVVLWEFPENYFQEDWGELQALRESWTQRGSHLILSVRQQTGNINLVNTELSLFQCWGLKLWVPHDQTFTEPPVYARGNSIIISHNSHKSPASVIIITLPEMKNWGETILWRPHSW